MSRPEVMRQLGGMRELDGLLCELDALAETDADVHRSLREIAQASEELRGALARVVPAVQDLELDADLRLISASATPEGDFDALELDRYGRVHQTCRDLKEQAVDLQGLQTQIEKIHLSLAASLARRTARMRGLREMLERVGPGDPGALLAVLGGEVAARHGVTLELEGEAAFAAADSRTLVTAGVLIERLAHYASGVVADQCDGAASELGFGIGFRAADGDLVVSVRPRGIEPTRLDPASAESGGSTQRAAQRLSRELARTGTQMALGAGALELRIAGEAVERAVLFVRAGAHALALPLDRLACVVRLTGVERLEADRLVLADGTSVAVLDLGALTGHGAAGGAGPRRQYAALIGSPVASHALLFDRVEDSARCRVLPAASPLPRLAAALGAATRDDGRTVMVLDPARAVARAAEATSGDGDAGTQAPRILVVDDSVTIRKVTQRMLVRNHLRVELARDGREALEQIASAPPDLVLLDIEMPRMNGFQLLEALRADRALAEIPVIMISSRTGEKHRAQAAALGVSTFLGKPFKERELLAAMMDMLQWRP